MRKFSFVLLLTLFSVLLSGCAICTQMPAQYKQSIHTFKMDPNIPVPKQMMYISTKSQIASVFGGPFAQMAVAREVDVPQEANLRKIAQLNNIQISQIVMQQITSQIKQKTNYKIIKSDNADAILAIKISNYGFASPGEFSGGKLKPQLYITVSLVKNGKVIWLSNDFVTTVTSGTPSFTYEQLSQNPNNMTIAWNAAAQRLASEIVSHM